MSDSEYEKEQEKEEESSNEKNTYDTRNRRWRSLTWQYFDQVNSNAHTARCMFCDMKFSYKGSTSNLTKHLRRKHNILPEIGNRLSRLSSDDPVDKKPKIIISDDGQIYEIEETQDNDQDNDKTDALDPDAVYLDEYVDEIKQMQKSKVKKHKPTITSRVHNVTRNSFERVQIPQIRVQNVPRGTNPLDLFGSYLVSILKELPDRESKRLQAEFVKAAIDAHLRSCEVNDPITLAENDTGCTTVGMADSGRN